MAKLPESSATKVIAVCIKLHRHDQMKVAERGMHNADEKF